MCSLLGSGAVGLVMTSKTVPSSPSRTRMVPSGSRANSSWTMVPELVFNWTTSWIECLSSRDEVLVSSDAIPNPAIAYRDPARDGNRSRTESIGVIERSFFWTRSD